MEENASQSFLLSAHGPNSDFETRRNSDISYVSDQQLNELSSERRISDSSRRSSYAIQLAKSAHLHQYKPIDTVHHDDISIIDLEGEESSEATSPIQGSYQLSQKNSSVASLIHNCLFPSTKRSFIGILNLRDAFTIFSIIQALAAFFSTECLIIISVNLDSTVSGKSGTQTFIHDLVLWFEVFQNHIVLYDASDPLSALYHSFKLLLFRVSFSWITALSTLALIRRYSDGLAFMTSIFLGWELGISMLVFGTRLYFALSSEWDSEGAEAFYILSSISSIMFSWMYLVVQLCYWTQEQRVLMYLARHFPSEYGPTYYRMKTILPETRYSESVEFLSTSGDLLTSRRPSETNQTSSKRSSILPERRVRTARRPSTYDQENVPQFEKTPEGGNTIATDDAN